VTISHLLTRRETLTHSLKLAGAGSLALAATKMSGLQALAQDSSQAGSALAGLGLPEIDVTITDSGYEGLSGSLDAGLYFVKATNNGSTPGFIEFMQLPEGMASADLAAMLAGTNATPEAGAMGTPGSGDTGGDQGPPDWYYTTYLAGGAGVGPGSTAQFVIDLQPGNYIVWAEDPSAAQKPVDLTVNGGGASPTAGDFPPATVAIQEQATDTGFTFVLGNALSAGSQVVEIANLSDQPHFVEIDTVPDGTTIKDVQTLLGAEMSGTPASGTLSDQDIQPFYFVGTQSGGARQWHEISLNAGTYVIACWIGDIKRGGVPHAAEGMINLIVVSGGGSATPTS